jgi:uncharacterized membrane protein
MNKDRFEAFSDGVFAFAITLLVLGVALPALDHPTEAQLTRALLGLWPNVLAYALSFAVISIMWQNHHALFRTVKRVDRNTVVLNLMLLSGTAFIPFGTVTLGQHPAMRASAFAYGLVLSYCATAYNLMLGHLIRTRAFYEDVTPELLAATRRAYHFGWFGYFLATLLALVVPVLSFAAYLIIAIYYLIPRGVDDDLNCDD